MQRTRAWVKNAGVPTWVPLVMEGATRGRNENARKQGSKIPRPHRLLQGWYRPAMLGPRPLASPRGLTTTVTTSGKEIPNVRRGGTRGPLNGPQCRQQALGSAHHATPRREGANTGMLNDLGIQRPAPKHARKARVLTPRGATEHWVGLTHGPLLGKDRCIRM